jgi:Fe2+ transport system protein FeoA
LDEFKGPGVANPPSHLATGVKQKAAGVQAHHETTVVDLKPAELAVIVQVKPGADVSRQLAHMGVGRGALITVERIAPLGDPISVKVRGGRLMLRKKDAANIVVVSK